MTLTILHIKSICPNFEIAVKECAGFNCTINIVNFIIFSFIVSYSNHPLPYDINYITYKVNMS